MLRKFWTSDALDIVTVALLLIFYGYYGGKLVLRWW